VRRLVLVAALVLGALTVTAPADAAKSCSGCDPTVVVVNGDGSVTVSTTATTKSDCLRKDHATAGECVLKVWNAANGLSATPTDGGPDVLAPGGCPCTAQYWVHAGQWHAFSAMSAAFMP
jgi:hypothetical protein